MSALEFIVETEPRPEQVQYLEDRIYEFNAGVTRIADGEWLAIFVRDHGGRIVAGICGNTWGGCCEIRQFWVEESLRGGGLGTRLLAAAEGEARRRGCTRIMLMTFSFQAPGFYARHGFNTVAVLDGYSGGHQNLIMTKSLDEVASAEDRFFGALLEADGAALDALLTPDFVLVDVMTGSEIPGSVLRELVAGGQLVFESIERVDSRVRAYGSAAVVTGQTRMRGRYEQQTWAAHSRYTHVYVRGENGWQLASAQGTPIAAT